MPAPDSNSSSSSSEEGRETGQLAEPAAASRAQVKASFAPTVTAGGGADGLRARPRAGGSSSSSADAPMRDFSVKKPEGLVWRKEYTQMALLVLGALVFSGLIFLFVITGQAPPPEEIDLTAAAADSGGSL